MLYITLSTLLDGTVPIASVNIMLIELVAQTGMCINGFSGPGLGPNAHLVQIVTWLPKYFTGTGTRCAAHVDAAVHHRAAVLELKKRDSIADLLFTDLLIAS